MAGELVRFQGAVMRIEKAVELMVQGARNPPALPHGFAGPTHPEKPLRIDVMRMCAVHRQPWGAVYILQKNGSYQYAKSIRVTKALCRTQYAPGTQEIVTLDERWLDQEECAWCGACEEGIFQCANCHKLVCGGLSNGRYFRCYCGGEGWAVERRMQHLAFVPRRTG